MKNINLLILNFLTLLCLTGCYSEDDNNPTTKIQDSAETKTEKTTEQSKK